MLRLLMDCFKMSWYTNYVNVFTGLHIESHDDDVFSNPRLF